MKHLQEALDLKLIHLDLHLDHWLAAAKAFSQAPSTAAKFNLDFAGDSLREDTEIVNRLATAIETCSIALDILEEDAAHGPESGWGQTGGER